MERVMVVSANSSRSSSAAITRRIGCAITLLLLLAILVAPVAWRWIVRAYYAQHIHAPISVPQKPVAIVFGAAVYGNGRLSTVLRDRMETAIVLYEEGKVGKILVSGDNGFENYNEPAAMKNYAIRARHSSRRC